MPFYEYECSSCKFYTEVMQKISDSPLTKCPSCGKKALVKLVSAPNFRLKGGGWYETDFKGDKESKRNLAGGDDASPQAESSTAPAKSDSPSKADASKPEAAKVESASSESASKPAAESGRSSQGRESSGSRVSSGGRESKSSSRGGGRSAIKPTGRAPAPVAKSRVAASKARAPVSRSKAKPAAKKKARR
jgi:putative FmdB family regulatory protein